LSQTYLAELATTDIVFQHITHQKMASLQVDVAQNPFPWSVALLASHQNVQIDWLAGTLQYNGKTSVEEIEAALASKLKGKEVRPGITCAFPWENSIANKLLNVTAPFARPSHALDAYYSFPRGSRHLQCPR
jgi:hypothetical protein